MYFYFLAGNFTGALFSVVFAGIVFTGAAVAAKASFCSVSIFNFLSCSSFNLLKNSFN